MKTIYYIIIFILLGTINVFPNDINILQPKVHPRLLLNADEEQSILTAIKNDTKLYAIHKRVLRFADSTIKEPPSKRIKEGKRLLGVSRTVLKRVFYLSYAYRMTKDKKYLIRAEKEMLAAASFSDWNPSHFLDVSEMSFGLAIGYDWLYNELAEDSKVKIRQAIVEKALKASKTKYAKFYDAQTNWNQVCNGGLVCSAIAIYENEPYLAKEIISKAVKTIPLALGTYAPDGGYPEGFGYWSYGTTYQVMLNDALERNFGHDFGLNNYPGFLKSSKFIQFMTAPSGECFNYSDSSSKAYGNIMMYWFAKKNEDLSLLWLEKKYLKDSNLEFGKYHEERFLPCLLIFASRINLDKVVEPKDKIWLSKGKNPLFVYREGWKEKDDIYLGVKGGSASVSHAHMDAGSFIFEKMGVRWAMDLGMQNYYSLESKGVDLWNMRQNSQRWDVFRIGSSSHNTITVNNKNHNVNGYADFTKVYTKENKIGVGLNLTSTLGNVVKKANRDILLLNNDSLIVIDNIVNGDSISSIRWTMCTPAKPIITNDKTIILSKDNKTLYLTVSSPKEVRLHIWNNIPPHNYDTENPNTSRVGYEILLEPNERIEIKVKLSSKNIL